MQYKIQNMDRKNIIRRSYKFVLSQVLENVELQDIRSGNFLILNIFLIVGFEPRLADFAFGEIRQQFGLNHRLFRGLL